MKLYVYSFYDGKLNCKEVEVEEKPKTYKALSANLPFIYRTMLNKSDIGHFIGYGNKAVFYTEPSKSKAKELFLQKFRRELSGKKNEVSILEEKVKCLESED